jgi:GxxExxY protein
MTLMDANGLLFKDEAYAIVGAAMEVHSELGPGFLEGVYGDALVLESEGRGIPFEREVDIPVLYKGKTLPHTYRADFLAFGQVIIEIKAIRMLNAPKL